MTYVTVYEVSSVPFKDVAFLVPGIIITAIAAILVFWPALLEKLGHRRKYGRIFSWCLFLFAVVLTISAGFAVVGRALSASQDLEDGNCNIVEGIVENFHPMPKEGHERERFEVSGVQFSYSDYVAGPGFNNTASHGGPIREGLQVRICHQSGNILRLEISE